MPKVNRTPPSTPQPEVKRASSNPNIPVSPNAPEFSNVSHRTKRLRSEASPVNELMEFKEEIMAMLTKWNANQAATLESFMSKITLELAELKSLHEKVQQIKTEIDDSASLMNNKYEEIKTRMAKLESERSEQGKYISQLEKHIQDMHENHRSSTIEIRNISPKEKEDVGDLSKIVTDMSKTLKVQVKPEDIRDIYRVQSNQSTSKPIVVEFQSVVQKENILRAIREFNKGKPVAEKINSKHINLPGERTSIYVADRLPSSLRKLFYEARKFASVNEFQFCWTKNGKIFLRKKEGEKPVLIRSETCFHDILHAQ